MILANSIAGPMSGGDRIWIELAKRWLEHKIFTITVVTTPEGVRRARDYGLDGANFVTLPSFAPARVGVYFSYLFRAFAACISTIRALQHTPSRIVFSSSDFIPDSLPGVLARILVPRTIWVAAFYMFAPSPFDEKSPYREKMRAKGLLYYFSQTIVFKAIQVLADSIFVTNEGDRQRFGVDGTAPERVYSIWGGVDNKSTSLVPDKTHRKYDAVFIGRLHPQKGVLQLVEIWQRVCLRRRDAKLAIIGAGELDDQLRNKIASAGLSSNVTIFGFQDGLAKIRIFKDSRIVVHPAIYDSGGMAACEAMACGLPGVSFDLPALKFYYPKGMIKTRCFDLDEFASNILRLVEDRPLYERLRREALDFAIEMDWDSRSKSVLLALQPVMRSLTHSQSTRYQSEP